MREFPFRTPFEAMRRWPKHRPLAVVCSNNSPSGDCRWVLSSPSGGLLQSTPGIVCDTQNQSKCEHAAPLHPLAWIDQELARADPPACWLAAFSYHLGPVLEPAIGPARATAWPLAVLLRCPWTLELAHDGSVRALGGDIASAHEVMQQCTPPDSAYELEVVDPAPNRDPYMQSVERAIDYIKSGDVYQANIAHRLRARIVGCPRAFAADLFESASPAHGIYMELPGNPARVVVSASPELFLRRLGSRLVTRPMKGTRPIAASASDLLEAEKDRAELNMITDLMRNDLGRVARTGSVVVDVARALERHGGSVLQTTATVSCQIDPSLPYSAMLQAVFPPGSVTGAPKIRAMQIIDELEIQPRDMYCGSLGMITPDLACDLNVAIRTALLTQRSPSEWSVDFSVGAGIVADSNPAGEWQETLDKADVLTRMTTSSGAHP